MKKVLLLLPAILALWVVQNLFAAYPREYPLYLGLLGFKKGEIERLREGGMATHTILNKDPGEFGISAARVFNVPVYYFRDYYRYIENYQTLFQFESVGKFQKPAEPHDLKPLRFTEGELSEFLGCKVKDCEMKLSADEIAMIPDKPDLKTDAGREAVSDVYRKILLSRLTAYQSQGLAGLGKYDDSPLETNPKDVADAHLLKFDHLAAYFPGIARYLQEYPSYKDQRIDEFFYWSRSHLGNKPVISIHHVITRRIGEDYVMVSRLVYSNHYYLSSMTVMHLINYADALSPWTLFVFEQRSLTDLHGPLEGFGRNILSSNLEKTVTNEFKALGKEMEVRYKSDSYANFPFGILPRDQR